MPIKRRYGRFKRRRYSTFRRRFSKRRGFRRFRGGKIARVWKAIAGIKRSHPKPEWKYFTASGTAVLGISTTPTFNAMALISQGVDNGQRIGHKIIIKKIRLWTEFYFDALEGGNYNYLRYGLVIHKNVDGGAPDPTDIWDNNVVPIEQGAPRRMEKLKYYTFLKDKKRLLLRNTDTQASPAYYSPFQAGPFVVRWNIRCNIPVTYTGTGNTIADIARNVPEFFCVSDSNLAPHPVRRYLYFRVYYVDN